MKTKLLCLLLFVSFITNAQVFFQTPYATAVTSTTATLNVYVNLNNTYQVGYQISTDSNFTGAPVQGQLNTFAGTHNLVKPVTGLSQNTTYFIRFRALSGGNATYSPVGTFTTESLAPAILGITSNPATTNSATINYTLNAYGSNSTSIVKYGTDVLVSSQIAGFPASGMSDTPGSIEISGLSPNTQYFYQIEATNGYGTRTSAYYTFTTSALTPIVSNVSSTVTTNSATINYSLNAGGGSSATSKIYYGLDMLDLNDEITGLSASGSNTTTGSVEITGLALNTTYYYVIHGTNEHGTEYGIFYTFITGQIPQLIAEYKFNNTYNNTSGTTPFASNAGTSFLTDRHGNANSAIYINQTGTTATIPGLPYGNNARTVSLWVKLDGMGATYNFLYNYGTSGSPEGAFINPTSAIHFSPNNTATTTNSGQIWYHYVFTYDGTTSKIYKNGTLINSVAVAKNTVNNSDLFRLGLSEGGAPNYFTGFIDDLQIYNYALSDTEAENLYDEQSLNTNNVEITNFKVYPNPVKDILNIETALEIQSVEIYTIQGQKVVSSTEKQINVSHLASGIYLVKTQDSNNKVSTNKNVIK